MSPAIVLVASLLRRTLIRFDILRSFYHPIPVSWETKEHETKCCVKNRKYKCATQGTIIAAIQPGTKILKCFMNNVMDKIKFMK